MQLTSAISIREMRREDLEFLAEWSAEAFAIPETGLQWTKAKMLKHLSDDFRGENSFVITEGTNLIGGILAYPCEYDRGKELFLHTIAIKKDKQKNGLGKLFLQWFIEYARSQGVTGIRLDSHTQLPSYVWYSQFGFELTGWQQQLLKLTK